MLHQAGVKLVSVLFGFLSQPFVYNYGIHALFESLTEIFIDEAMVKV